MHTYVVSRAVGLIDQRIRHYVSAIYSAQAKAAGPGWVALSQRKRDFGAFRITRLHSFFERRGANILRLRKAAAPTCLGARGDALFTQRGGDTSLIRFDVLRCIAVLKSYDLSITVIVMYRDDCIVMYTPKRYIKVVRPRDCKRYIKKLMYRRCIAAIHQEKRYIKLLMYRVYS